ncbi:hypothetical protein ACV566_12180 [Staphylococcus aureus]
MTQAVNQAKDNLHGDQKLADDKQHAVTDLNQLNGLNNPQRQALVSQINNAATRGEVAQKLAEAKAMIKQCKHYVIVFKINNKQNLVASLLMKINRKKMLTKQQFKMHKI